MTSRSRSRPETRTIRRALAANLAEINRVIRASKSHWRQPQAYLQAALPLLAVDDAYLAANLCFEVVEGDAVVCFFAIADDDGGKSLDHLWVRPDRLACGIGRLACEHVVALARERRWRRLRVLPEPDAAGFYRRLGFEDTGRRVDSRVPGGPRFPVLQMHFDV
jgi:GNAT superfamily N-acetyltransferase